MELKEKGNVWLTMWQYLRSNYDEKPNGLCSLFWGGLLGSIIFIFAFFPFGLGRLIYTKIRGEDYFESEYGALLGGFLNIVILLCWGGGFSLLLNEVESNFWFAFLVGPFVIPVLLAVFFGMVYSGVLLYDKWQDTEPNENIQVLTEGLSSFWNKVCPRIDWK